MKLKVLGRYTNEARSIDVFPGDEIEVRDELGQWLLKDAPGTFAEPGKEAESVETAEGEQKAFDYSPDGHTVAIDPVPAVADVGHSGVTVTHQADADEQARVAEEQQARIDEAQEASEEDAAEGEVLFTPAPAFVEEVDEEERKAMDAPPADKAIKRAPRQK
jgi:hypothetical protein